MSSSKILDTDEQAISSTDFGEKRGLDVSIISPVSAFGELQTVSPRPVVQLDAIYGKRENVDTEIFSNATGSVTATAETIGTQFFCQTGTNNFGYGLIRSLRAGRYRPGQGLEFKFTACYSEPASNSVMRAGGVTVGNEISFGYNNTDFGVFYRSGGRLEVQYLDISTATGNQTVTLNLDGTGFDVSLTGADPTTCAYQIAQAAATFTGWNLQNIANRVMFIASAVGDKTGTFSATTTGTFTGTFAEQGAGADNVDTFITQTSWNVNTLQADTHGSFVLDPQKGNVFKIGMQYLGYGSLNFSVENPKTGLFQQVHQIQFANSSLHPSFDIPIMKLGWFAANLGNTTNISIKGASGEIAISGGQSFFRNPIGHGNSVSGVGTTLTGVLGIKARLDFNGIVNLQEVFPLRADVAVDGTKPAVVEIHINPTVTGQENWKYHSESESIILINETSVTIGADTSEVVVVSLAKSGSSTIDLKQLGIVLLRGDSLYIAIKATSGTTDTSVGITWVED